MYKIPSGTEIDEINLYIQIINNICSKVKVVYMAKKIIQKMHKFFEFLKSTGIQVLFPSPYSYENSPIEKLFAYCKTHITLEVGETKK